VHVIAWEGMGWVIEFLEVVCGRVPFVGSILGKRHVLCIINVSSYCGIIWKFVLCGRLYVVVFAIHSRVLCRKVIGTMQKTLRGRICDT
jgi:hypothetical protein